MITTSNKLVGSYYTPHRVIMFTYKYLSHQNKNIKNILEPSAGDGRFIKIFLSSKSATNIVGVELFEDKVEYIKKEIHSSKLTLLASDFLDFYSITEDKFDLIIGNPPYINIKNMDKSFIESSRALCRNIGLPESVIQNAWVSFVLAASQLLSKEGTIFFVLPIEFLQVNYAERLRAFLEREFNTIHIICFSERMFPDIEQETCLVYLANERKKLPYILYQQYKSFDSTTPFYQSKIERNKPLKKWSNAILSDEELDLLNRTSTLYPQIKDIAQSTPGIVTGANSKFILTKDEVIQYSCKHYVKPIISKGSTAKNVFEINQELILKLESENQKIYLLDLAGKEFDSLPIPLQEYLNIVAQTKRNGIAIQHSYKCSKRKPWYGVPIVKSGSAIFFKRYDSIPRFSTNPEYIYTTDIAYGLRLTEGINPENLVFCFYNSLTLAQCEFAGRFYAGGVIELTPNEFKSLSIPYENIKKSDISIIKNMFTQNINTEEIISFVNSKTLSKKLTTEEINKLNTIRSKLILRRK